MVALVQQQLVARSGCIWHDPEQPTCTAYHAWYIILTPPDSQQHRAASMFLLEHLTSWYSSPGMSLRTPYAAAWHHQHTSRVSTDWLSRIKHPLKTGAAVGKASMGPSGSIASSGRHAASCPSKSPTAAAQPRIWQYCQSTAGPHARQVCHNTACKLLCCWQLSSAQLSRLCSPLVRACLAGVAGNSFPVWGPFPAECQVKRGQGKIGRGCRNSPVWGPFLKLRFRASLCSPS